MNCDECKAHGQSMTHVLFYQRVHTSLKRRQKAHVFKRLIHPFTVLLDVLQHIYTYIYTIAHRGDILGTRTWNGANINLSSSSCTSYKCFWKLHVSCNNWWKCSTFQPTILQTKKEVKNSFCIETFVDFC